MSKPSDVIPVSVFVVAQNEATDLPQLLSSVKQFAEVIVVDSGSTDQTPQLAAQGGAKVLHQAWLGYAGQKQFALEQCKHDWVLNLDADEVVTPAMVTEIKRVIQQENIDAVRFSRNDSFIGRMPPSSVKKPNNVRLYRRNKAKFDTTQLVHETAKIDGNVVKVETCFDHYGYDDIATLATKLNTYSGLKAQQKFSRGKRGSILKLTLIVPVEFLRKLILQRLIMFGRRGFILAALNAYYAFLKEAKLVELGMRSQDKKRE